MQDLLSKENSTGSAGFHSHQLVAPAVIISPGQRDSWARVHGQGLPAL